MAEELEQSAIQPEIQPESVQQAPPNTGDPVDKVKTLYDALTSDHYSLGDIDQFRQKMQDPDKASKLYDAATADHYQLGTKDEFISKMTAQSNQQQNIVNQDTVGMRPATNNFVSSLDKRQNSLKSQDKNYKPTLGSVTTNNKVKSSPDDVIISTIDMFKSLASLVPETASSLLRVGSRLLNYGGDPTSSAHQALLDKYGGKNSADQLADNIDAIGNKMKTGTVGSDLGEALKLPAMIAGGILTGDAPLSLQAITPMLMAGSMHNSAYHEAISAGASNGGANLFATVTASAGMLINGAAIAGVGATVKGLASKVIAKAAINELAESGASKITQQSFQEAIASNASRIIKGITGPAGIEAGKTLAMEFGAGVASHEFDQAAMYVHNHVEQGVKHNIETFGQNALSAVKQGGLYALIGSLGAGAKFIHDVHGTDAVGDHITNAIANDPSSADVMRNHADQLLENSKIDPADRESPFAINYDQYVEIHQKIDRVDAINSSIPDHVSLPEDRAKAIGIISQRNEIDNRIATLETFKSTLDEGYHEPIDAQIEKLTEVRDGLSKSLKNVNGNDDPMPVPSDKLLNKESNSEPATNDELVKDKEPEKDTDLEMTWEERKQVILNNRKQTDDPVEYYDNSKSKSNFADIIKGFRSKVGEVSGKYLETLQEQVESLRLYHSKEGDGNPKISDVIDRHTKELADLKASIGPEGRVGGKAKGAFNKENKLKVDALVKSHQRELHTVIDNTQKEYESLLGEVDAKHAKNTYSILKASVKEKQTIQDAKNEFLNKTKELLGKLGNNAPNKVKKIIPNIIKIANGVHNKASLGKALDKMEDHVAQIFQAEGEKKAVDASKKLTRTISTFKGVDPRLTRAIQQLAQLGKKPKLLADPHEYADFARNIVDPNGKLVVKTNDIERYVNEQMVHVRQALKDNAIASIQSKIDKMESANPGSTHEIKAIDVYDDDSLHSNFFNDDKNLLEKKEEKPTVLKVVTDMVKEAQGNLPSEDGLSPKQAATIRALKNIDPDNKHNPMSLADRKILNFALHNINVNGNDVILKGTDELVQYYLSNELHNSIEASRKNFEGSYFNFLKRWGNATRDIFGAKTPSALLRLNKNKVTFNQAVKGLNPNAEFVRKVYGSYLKPFELDYGKAKGEITLHVKDLLTLHVDNNVTREDAVRMRIFSILRQVNLSSTHSEDLEFKAFKDVVAASINTMDKHFGGVKGDAYKRQSELVAILHKSGLADLFKKHIDSITKDNMEELLKITDKHWNVIHGMDGAHDDVKPAIMAMYEKMGIDASNVHNYTHMDYLPIDNTQEEGMATQKSTEAVAKSFFGKADIDNLGPHVISREDLASAPKNSYLNLDQASSFTRGMNKQLMSAYTISNRMLIHNMMNDSRTNLVFDRTMENADKVDNNANFFKKLIQQNIGDAMGTTQRNQHGWMNAENFATVMLNNGKSLFYRGTLGSVFQYPKQYVESGVSAAILLSDPAAYLHGMGFIKNHKAAWNEFKAILIENGSPVLRRMVDREDLHSSALDDAYTAESTGYVDIHNSFTKKSEKLGEFLISPLKKGDAAVSLHTFISAYTKSLKNQGYIKKYSDFNEAFLKTHKLDPIASAYADDMVERTNAKVEGPFRANVLQDNGEKTLKTLFYNMKTFQLHSNVEARLALRNIMSGVDGTQSARQMLAYGASQVASGAMKLVAINTVRTTAAMGILYAILGEDKFNKLQDQRLEQLQKGGRLTDEDHLTWAQQFTGWNLNNGRNIMNISLQIVSDLAMGSQDNISQGLAQFGADFLYKELIYSSIQGQMEKADARKSLFYSDNNFFGYGSYQGLVNGVINPLFGDGKGGKSIFDRIKNVATPEDKLKLGASQFIASSAQLYLGADVGRITQMVNANLQKYAENNEFKLDSYYENIKGLVEKTGIPILPLNLDAVNKIDLRDPSGKELMLSGSEIKDLDRAYATYLNENLNADELIKGDKEEAKTEVSHVKKEALETALDQVVGENKYTIGADYKKEEQQNHDPKPANKYQYNIQSN